MKVTISLCLAILLVIEVNCLKVRNCPQTKTVEDYKLSVDVPHCTKPPCRLKKGTTAKVNMKFTASTDTTKLTNEISALIVGIPFPFIGVDGSSACDQIYEVDGKTKVGCSLKSGKEYVYKNQFDVLDFYPSIKLTVHWALKSGNGETILCFELPARIID